jgi:hypothetical protein
VSCSPTIVFGTAVTGSDADAAGGATPQPRDAASAAAASTRPPTAQRRRPITRLNLGQASVGSAGTTGVAPVEVFRP